MIARRQLSRRRPGRVEPQDRRGPRPGQCRRGRLRRATSWSATMSSSPTRCATARSTICWSCSKAAAGSPRARGSPHRRVTTLENAIYSPCPVTTATGCPQRPSWAITAARVIDDPAHQPRPLPGRAAAAVRRQPAAAAGLQHRHRRPAGRPAGWSPTSAIRRKKGFEIAAPYHWQIGPNRDLTRHAARLHRRAAGDRGQVPRAQPASAHSSSAASSPTARSRAPIPTTTSQPTDAASAAISKATASSSSTRCGASPARSGWPATRPSPAATTSPATTGCAASSTPSGSAPIATSRSPAGRSRACASTTSRSRSRSRFRRSMRASGSTTRCSAARSSCRPTACRSSASKDRTRSARSPARDGTCGG